MSKQGFINLHRSILDWQWFTDVNTAHLFIYCLLRANYKDTKWRDIDIKRGQFVSSYNTLSVETGLSVQTLRTCFKHLKNSQELTSEPTSKFSLITILNYDKYQSELTSELTGEQQATNKQLTTDNKDNKEKNKRSTPKKIKYSDCILLTDDQFQKLLELYGSSAGLQWGIDRLNNYKMASGAKYKSDYHVLISWVYKEYLKNQNSTRGDNSTTWIDCG